MREIKFRVFDGKQFSYFVMGQPFGGWELSVYADHCINGRQFQEYTGLKDKNGKEIYEGDIVIFNTQKSVVKFDYDPVERYGHGDCSFSMYAGFSYGGYGNSEDDVEVIGNIYENEDLLTKDHGNKNINLF